MHHRACDQKDNLWIEAASFIDAGTVNEIYSKIVIKSSFRLEAASFPDQTEGITILWYKTTYIILAVACFRFKPISDSNNIEKC